MSMRIRASVLVLVAGLTVAGVLVGSVVDQRAASELLAAQLCVGLLVGENAPDACVPLP